MLRSALRMENNQMARTRFTLSNFLVRWGLALVLVLATFNPMYSYTQWVLGGAGGSQATMAVQVLIGLILLVGYIVFLRATLRSIGMFGMLLVVVILMVLLWVLWALGLFQEQVTTGEFWIWVGLLVFATVLAIGMSWSHIRRRLSGQYDMDDVET
jgi:O-antigen/teichoic acid export membrane protein